MTKNFKILVVSLAIFFASFAFPVSAKASTYYISSSNGNDTNIGSIELPWKSISKGLGVVGAGDTLYVRSGTYPAFTVTKSGTSANYITISGYNNEKPIITGGSEQIVLKGVSYVKIVGFEVKGATASWGAGIHVMNNGVSPQYNVIEGNIVHDNTGSNTSGILIEDGSNNKVLNNEVFNNYFCGIQILSHPTQSPNGITGNEVTGNKSYNNTLSGGNSDGIKLEGPGTKNSIISNNIVYGNSDDGIDTWNASHNTVIGNVSYNQLGPGDGNGFKLGGSTTGGYNLVKQNVSYNNKRNGFDTNGGWGSLYYNNVAYNNTNFGFEDGYRDITCTVSTCPSTYINNIGYNNVRGNFSANSWTAVSHNNLWYSDGKGPQVFYNYSLKTTLAAFYSASGNRLDNPTAVELSSLQSAPLFENVAQGIFTLQPSSPAIDKGDPSNPGQIAVVGIPDIGAIEYGNVVNPSPTPIATGTPLIKLGDANNDGFVDEIDYNDPYWFSNYLKVVTCGASCGDFDRSGNVDGMDYVIWLANYGR